MLYDFNQRKKERRTFDVLDEDGNLLAVASIARVFEVQQLLESITGKPLKVQPSKIRLRRPF
jgi:hypothetical protein